MLQEGIQPLRRALRRELPVEGVWIPKDVRLPSDVYHMLRSQGVPIHRMDSETFIRRFGSPARVIYRLPEIVTIPPDTFLSHLQPRDFGVVLDEVQDVGNVGNIARTAAFFGATGVVLSARRSIPLEADLHHLSSGGASRLQWCRVPHLLNFLKEARSRGIWVYVLETDGSPLDQVAFMFPLLLVVGSEKRGVRKTVRHQADAVVKIPGQGLSSLNVASATAIALYEIARAHRS